MREEERQAAVFRVEQQVEPPLGNRGQFGDGNLQEVEHDRNRLAVKIAAGDEVAILWEDQRVVGNRVGFDLGDAPHVSDRVAHRPVDDRHAAERVRILNALALDVRMDDLRIGQQQAKISGDAFLTGVRP